MMFRVWKWKQDLHCQIREEINNGFSFCRRSFTWKRQPHKEIRSPFRSILSYHRVAVASCTRRRSSCAKTRSCCTRRRLWHQKILIKSKTHCMNMIWNARDLWSCDLIAVIRRDHFSRSGFRSWPIGRASWLLYFCAISSQIQIWSFSSGRSDHFLF